jgi:four helix bundle protein
VSERSPIRTFTDLDEWQLAIKLVIAMRDVVRRIPLPERYDFDQTRRAALSVSRNIAEGFGRDHLGDFLHHLSMARGSVFEVQADLHALRALALIPDSELEPVMVLADRIGRMLASHSRTLRSRLKTRSNRAAFFDLNRRRGTRD